jgi:hypothetical protein
MFMMEGTCFLELSFGWVHQVGVDVTEEGKQVMLVLKESEVVCKSFKTTLLALVTDGVGLSKFVTSLAESNMRSIKGTSYWNSYDEIWKAQVARRVLAIRKRKRKFICSRSSSWSDQNKERSGWYIRQGLR